MRRDIEPPLLGEVPATNDADPFTSPFFGAETEDRHAATKLPAALGLQDVVRRFAHAMLAPFGVAASIAAAIEIFAAAASSAA